MNNPKIILGIQGNHYYVIQCSCGHRFLSRTSIDNAGNYKLSCHHCTRHMLTRHTDGSRTINPEIEKDCIILDKRQSKLYRKMENLT